MREVQQDSEGEVSAGGVAADDHVAGRAAGLCEDVAQGVDGLAQLGWVGVVWGEGVCDEEEGDVVVGSGEGSDEGVVECEVAFRGGNDETSAFVD